MLNLVGEVLVDIITDQIKQIFLGRVFSEEWKVSNIVNCYNGKGDTFERRNYI